MDYVKIIEKKFMNSFKVLNGLPNYFGIEEMDGFEFEKVGFQNNLTKLIKVGGNLGINRIGALINRKSMGDHWKNFCNVIFLRNIPIGISIPHIEPGTLNEGRLFYFGILPEHRGKGLSSVIHYQSLIMLKQMGATYYIGSTHDENIKMQKVFQRNDCITRAHTESYYLYLNK
ncbi:hypothetical protein [Chengkuizengella axinellae]|uniref:hypothetical protein n=1 Tax=Chengkuizengella axinellae TaxID=3064388 RepID=UPI003526F7CD